MCCKPRADLFDVAEAVMAGPLRKARIACQLGCPAIDLALEKAIDPAEVTQAGGFGFDGGERREAVDTLQAHPMPRSEERRVGKECVSPCRSRWSPSH